MAHGPKAVGQPSPDRAAPGRGPVVSTDGARAAPALAAGAAAGAAGAARSRRGRSAGCRCAGSRSLVWAEILKDELLDRAAALSYYFVFALFPTLLFLTTLSGCFRGRI